MIDRWRRFRYDVLIIDIGRDADDSPWALADADEVHDRVGPHDVAIEGILSGKHALRDALTDDDDRLAAAAVIVVEVTAFDDGHTERSEETRRDRVQLCHRIFFVSALH